MVVSDLVRAAALAAAAAVIAIDAPAVIVYLLAILVTLVSQAFQPAESALLPTLAESPEELASANVANSTIEAAGYFVGPALGVAGLVGGIVAVGLVGARRLGLTFGLALILWGTPILLIGLWAEAAPAFVLIALAGLGLTLVDVAGFTLLQRAVPEEVLARVFGVLHSAFFATGGIGAILAPALISWLGIRGALIVAGAVLPAVTIPSFGLLARIDRTLTVP